MTFIELLTATPYPVHIGAGVVHRCIDIEDEPDGKFCIKCEEVKPLSDFYYRRSRNAYTTECRKCHAERTAENYRKKKNAPL